MGGGEPIVEEPEPNEIFEEFLNALGFKPGDIEWIISLLKWSIQKNLLPSEKSQTDSEW
jgi:hypothetical protein